MCEVPSLVLLYTERTGRSCDVHTNERRPLGNESIPIIAGNQEWGVDRGRMGSIRVGMGWKMRGQIILWGLRPLMSERQRSYIRRLTEI